MRTFFIIVTLFIFFSTFCCNAFANDDDDLKTALMAAEIYCFSLESFIFDFREDFKSRKDVYDFFRRGFGPSISEKLSENIWNENQVKLKPGDKIMDLPKNVWFRSITIKSAVLVFETPSFRKNIWGLSENTELVFKRESDCWKLFQKDKHEDNKSINQTD